MYVCVCVCHNSLMCLNRSNFESNTTSLQRTSNATTPSLEWQARRRNRGAVRGLACACADTSNVSRVGGVGSRGYPR